MKITISGGTGMIGSAICHALLAEGHDVTAISRDCARAAQALPVGIKGVDWSGRNWQDVVQQSDAIINLAGESVGGARWTPEFKETIRSSRVMTTQKLVDALLNRPDIGSSAVLVSASAVGYYGDCGDDTVTEERGPGSDFLAEVCRQWEAEAERASTGGVRVARMRIGLVLARTGALHKMLYPFPGPISPYKLGLGGPLGSGKQWWPWIHIDDVVALFMMALHNSSATGAINVTSPQPVRNRDFAHAIGTCLGRPAVLSAPSAAIRMIAGEFSHALLTGQRAIPAAAERLGYSFKYTDLNEALKSLL